MDHTFILYRGIKDILPSRVTHNLVKQDGLWGPGVYMSEDQTTAAWYAFKSCDNFGLVFKYEVRTHLLDLETDKDFEDDVVNEGLRLTKTGCRKLDVRSELVFRADCLDMALVQGFDGIRIIDKKKFGEPITLLHPDVLVKVVELLVKTVDTSKAEKLEIDGLYTPDRFEELESKLQSYMKFSKKLRAE